MAKAGKKKWYTIAWFTREGQPHPAYRLENFKRVYQTEKDVLQDLSHGMTHFNPHAVYVAMVWDGSVSERDALHNKRPHFHVYENGEVHVLT